MKQLTCEMCGGTDLIKQDGVFVCQSCGTKYSIEEAKRMMIDGTVNIVGTVSIDNSASYDRIFELAKDAFNDKRFDSAYDYYCQLIDIRNNIPHSILRQGLSILGKDGIQSTIPSSCVNRVNRAYDLLMDMPSGEDRTTLVSAFVDDIELVTDEIICSLDNEITNLNSQKLQERGALDTLADLGRPMFVASANQADDDKVKRHNAVIEGQISAIETRRLAVTEFATEYSQKLLELAGPNAHFRYYFKHDISKAIAIFDTVTLDKSELKVMANKPNILYNAVRAVDFPQVEMLIKMGSDVNAKTDRGITPIYAITAYSISEGKADEALQILDTLLEHDAIIDADMSTVWYGKTRTLLNTDTNQKIKDALLERNPELSSKVTSAPSGGCYIATAVYGSYDCPQVWTLRRHRDYTLAETWYGRTFIHTYYTISPTIVKWFGHTEWFKKIWKGRLDKMIVKLNNEGVEDTPYKDKDW